jgi:hypothetical protein
MNCALYYIAAVIAFLMATFQALGLAVAIVGGGLPVLESAILFIYPVLLAVAGGLFWRRFQASRVNDGAFDKQAVVSVIGIICTIWGLYELASNLQHFMALTKLNMEFDARTIETILAPIVLAGLGLYFGFFYRANKQV